MKFLPILPVLAIVLVAGCIGQTIGQNQTQQAANQTIKIGFIGPLTGDASSYGIMDRNAVILAVEDINEAGGVNGKTLELIAEDGKCTGKEAVTAATKLIDVDKVKIIAGGSCSSETLGIAPLAESNEVIVFSSLSSSPEITNAGDYVFRNYQSDAIQGVQVAEIISSGYRRAAVLSENTDYAQGLRGVFKSEFARLGGIVVADEVYDQSAKDMRTQLSKIKDAVPEAIFLAPQAGSQGGIAMKQALELGITAPMFAAIPVGFDWLEAAGNAAEGLVYLDAPEVNQSDTRQADLLARYRERFGEPVWPYAVFLGYDRTQILAEALRECGEDTGCIKQWIYDNEYSGIGMTYQFDSNGDVTSSIINAKQIVNGTGVPYRG